MRILGLILAGGAGRRLGGVDKAFSPLHGRPMIELVLERLAPQTEVLAISANGDPARFAAFGLPVLDDGVNAGKGPLAGLAAGLEWAAAQNADALLTVPVDTPFVPLDLADRLHRPPAVAFGANRVHHLVALWPASARAVLADSLAGPGPYRVADFAAKLGMRPVRFGNGSKHFVNINTADDLAAAAPCLCGGKS